MQESHVETADYAPGPFCSRRDLISIAIITDTQVVCHGIPDRRPLEEGDILNVDISVFYKGYHGDLNETFVVGEVDESSKKLIKTTYEVCLSKLCQLHSSCR